MRHVISHPTCICVCAWIHVKITGHKIFVVSIVGFPPPFSLSTSPTPSSPYVANLVDMKCFAIPRVFVCNYMSEVFQEG